MDSECAAEFAAFVQVFRGARVECPGAFCGQRVEGFSELHDAAVEGEECVSCTVDRLARFDDREDRVGVAALGVAS